MSDLGLVVGSRAPDPTKNNVLKTVLLVVGEMAGGGIVTLPDAVYQAGPVLGLLTIILAGILACYTGTILAKCFQIATRTFPDPDVALLTEIDSPGPGRQPLLSTDPALEPVSPSHNPAHSPSSAVEEEHYQKHPYIYIGGCALGKIGEYAVLIMQLLALTGVGIVFIIISAENLNSIWPDHTVKFWMWMVVIVVIPLSWLESPKDFWQAAVIAALASFVVVVGATILSIQQAPSPFPGGSHVTFDSYFLAFGTIMFAYGGHALFPTLQVDMQHPHHFRRAMAISFAIILCMYVAVCSAGYYSFGALLDVQGNILLNLHGKTADGLTGVLTIHLLFAIIIIQNPVSQLFDRWLHTPPGFNIWRVILRTNYIALCAVIAFNVPAGDFICIVNLIGGITTPALGFVFPSLFYLILKHKSGYRLHWAEWALHATVVSVGVFCGVSSTRSAIISDSCAFLR